MLKKVISLKNVGRFAALASVGDVTFSQLTLIYGPNGSGKSTLVQVLRAANAGAGLDAYAKLGAAGLPEVDLLLDGGLARIRNAAWSGTDDFRVAIFDKTFVERTVHTGGIVDTIHRREFLNVVLGETEVAAASEIAALDDQIRVATKELGDCNGEFVRLASSHSVTAGTFKALSEDDSFDLSGIPARQAELQRALSNAMAVEELRTRPAPAVIGVPPLPDAAAIIDLVGRALPAIAEETQRRFDEHLAGLHAPSGRQWIEQGYALATEHGRDDCPFCAQPLASSELFRTYGDVFTNCLGEHTEALRQQRDAVASVRLDGVRRAYQASEAHRDFWRAKTGKEPPKLDLEIVEAELELAKATRLAWLDRAIGDPSSAVGPTAEERVGAEAIVAREAIEAYNTDVREYATHIEATRAAAATVSTASVKAELTELAARTPARAPTVRNLLARIATAEAEKKRLDGLKKAARQRLDQAQRQRLDDFSTRVNATLARLGARFEIANMKNVMPGGKPAVDFAIRLDGHDLNVSKKSDDQPSFATILSEGDKASLALAVFHTQLNVGTPENAPLVVFDDPMSSLDVDRRTATIELIDDLVQQGLRVVVLSHLARFLLQVQRRCRPQQAARAVKLNPTNELISEACLHDESRGQYKRAMDRLKACAEGEELADDDTRRLVRLVLEEYLRLRFPHAWSPGEWLGQFRQTAREQQLLTEADLTELDNLCAYASPEHHGESDPGYHRSSANEVRTYARRTYTFITRPAR